MSSKAVAAAKGASAIPVAVRAIGVLEVDHGWRVTIASNLVKGILLVKGETALQ
jgi:hypothetical protein